MSDCNVLKLSFLAVACAPPKKVMEPVEPVPGVTPREKWDKLTRKRRTRGMTNIFNQKKCMIFWQDFFSKPQTTEKPDPIIVTSPSDSSESYRGPRIPKKLLAATRIQPQVQGFGVERSKGFPITKDPLEPQVAKDGPKLCQFWFRNPLNAKKIAPPLPLNCHGLEKETPSHPATPAK